MGDTNSEYLAHLVNPLRWSPTQIHIRIGRMLHL